MTLSLAARIAVVAAAALAAAGCAGKKKDESGLAVSKPRPVVQPSVGMQQRFGDEIVVAGHFYRIGTPVVTWMDPGGYDAYRTSRHFAPYREASYEATTREIAEANAGRRQREDSIRSPDRYGLRYTDATTRATSRAATQPGGISDYVAKNYATPSTRPLSDEQFNQVRNGGWPLELLQEKVDQFVLHYDVAGTSANCFKVLHDGRGYSVQLMLDLDGTIYQTLDLKERAYQATKANDRSIGIEIANIGSYGINETQGPLQAWYKKDENGQTYISIPERLGGMNSQRTKPTVLRPARNEAIVAEIQGGQQRMYDLTPQQYAALIKLTAALADVFPKIKLDYPKDPSGKLITRALSDTAWGRYQGVLGHYHVQTNKSDPGAAFQWDHLIDNARRELAARKGAPALLAKQ